jgi:chromosome segregation ATPase
MSHAILTQEFAEATDLERALMLVAEFHGDERCSLNCHYAEVLAKAVHDERETTVKIIRDDQKRAERLQVRARQVGNLRRGIKQLQRAYDRLNAMGDRLISRNVALGDECARLKRETTDLRRAYENEIAELRAKLPPVSSPEETL